MAEESRHLHLRGALSAARSITHGGKECLIVPVIALMDGVIHAVNASNPERVTAATLAKAAASWNGRPLVLGHPTKNGRQCSANDPSIEATHHFGTIFNSRMVGPKLLMDAYVDPVRAEKVGGKQFVQDLRDGKQIEVSVGAYVQTKPEEGTYNGRAYKAAWLETHGDHLAFLPGGKGACSIEMGCGAHRAASEAHGIYLVTAEGFETLGSKDCSVCNGTGQVKNEKKQEDCPSCEGLGKITTAETNDGTAVEEVQMKKVDAIKALTACPCSGFVAADAKELEAFSEERLTAMAEAATKRKAAEDKAAADLKAAQDKTAADLKAAEDAKKTTEEKLNAQIAELKAASEKPFTEDDARLPQSIRTLVADKKAADAAEKTAIVAKLKAASTALTEEQLNAKSLEDLKILAQFAKVETTANYSGRSIPAPRAAAAGDMKQFTPPDPYEAGIKALQASK